MIALQFCAGFCDVTMWISHKYTHTASLLSLHPTPLGPDKALSWALYAV